MDWEGFVIFIRLKDGVEPTPSLKQDLIKHMRKSVGAIATPEQIYFTSKLPKTRSGKIVRRILKAVVEKANIGDISTLEDETAVQEVLRSYQETEQAQAAVGQQD